MMKRFALGALVLAMMALAGPASAVVINFDDQGLTGPSTFAAAGPAQHLVIPVGPVIATFDGGVILENTTALPANRTALYGTAYFGHPTLTNPLRVSFNQPITNFFLDVYNGLTTNITYRVADNMGNSAVFTLPPNLNGGQTQIGFAATGTLVTITSLTPPQTRWDFFIDNIGFNEPLPVPEPSTLLLGAIGLGALFLRRVGRRD